MLYRRPSSNPPMAPRFAKPTSAPGQSGSACNPIIRLGGLDFGPHKGDSRVERCSKTMRGMLWKKISGPDKLEQEQLIILQMCPTWTTTDDSGRSLPGRGYLHDHRVWSRSGELTPTEVDPWAVNDSGNMKPTTLPTLHKPAAADCAVKMLVAGSRRHGRRWGSNATCLSTNQIRVPLLHDRPYF